MERVNKGDLIDCLQPAVGMLPIMGSVAPYFFSYYGMHARRQVLRPAAQRFFGTSAAEFAKHETGLVYRHAGRR
ncbi:MAG: hypothetical protein HC904_14550 [Blastochloris sp.]|nr:hypothetical protein [Blastochloris sp.]